MITDPKVKLLEETSNDVFHNIKWPLFSQSPVKEEEEVLPNLNVVSFEAQTENPLANIESAKRACAEKVKEILEKEKLSALNYQPWLFLVNAFWEEKRPSLMYKRLWKRLKIAQPLDFLTDTVDVIIEREKEVRFAGVGLIKPHELSPAIDRIYNQNYALIILSSREGINSEVELESMMRTALSELPDKKDFRIDVPALALKYCPQGDMFIRANGPSRERFVSIDCVASSKISSLITNNT